MLASAACRLVAGSRRMGQSGRSTGLRTVQTGALKPTPGPAGCELRREGWRLLQAGFDARVAEGELSRLLREGAVPPAPASDCRTMGCERDRMRRRLPRDFPRRKRSAAADAERRTEPEKLAVPSLRAGSDVRGGDATAGQSGISQLKLSVVPGESIVSIVANRSAKQWQSSRQRLPKSTNGCRALATAKQERRSAVLVLAHPPVYVNGA
jgi:hypothetical protein